MDETCFGISRRDHGVTFNLLGMDLGENADKLNDRFLTESCCVVSARTVLPCERDRINASLKTSLTFDRRLKLRIAVNILRR